MTFWLYSFVCLLSIIYIGVFVPETKDRNLEDVAAVISNDLPGEWYVDKLYALL